MKVSNTKNWKDISVKPEMPKPQPKPQPETVKQTTEKESPEIDTVEENDLLNMLKQPTEKDSEAEFPENDIDYDPLGDLAAEPGKEATDEDIISGLDNPDDLQFLFDDYKLLADLGVETIDIAFSTTAQLIAGEFNEDKFSISDKKRNRLKRPLALILKKKGKKFPPELVFTVMLLVSYAPILSKAVMQRIDKSKMKKKRVEYLPKNTDIENVPMAEVVNPAMNNSPANNPVNNPVNETYERVKPNNRQTSILDQIPGNSNGKHYLTGKAKQTKKGQHKKSCPKRFNKKANCNCK